MKAIIIHGTKGSPAGNWFPWLSEELRKIEIDTLVPSFPTPENQTIDSWIAALNSQSCALDSETLLVGHSLGAIFALRLVEKSAAPVFATILVSPPGQNIGIPEFDRLNASFFESEFDWDKIQKNAGKLLFFMGDNDPYVPQDQMLELARKLILTPNVIKGGQHLNAEAGYTRFPQMLDSIKNLFCGHIK